MGENQTYHPSYLVRRVHHLYHMNSQFKLVDSHFNVTSANFDSSNEYEEGLITLPYLIASISTLLIFIFTVALWARVCFDRCRCRPDYNTESIFNKPFLRKYFGSAKYLSRVFIICAVFVILCDQFMYYGYVLIVAGFNLGNDNFNFFKDLFQSLDNDGESLQATANAIGLLVSQSLPACPSAAALADPIGEFNDDVVSYLDIVSPISGHIDDYQDYYRYWVYDTGTNAFWFIYGLLIFCVMVFAFGYRKQSRFTLQCALCPTMFVVFLMVWFVCFMLIFLMGLADFCYEPTDNLINLVPAGEDRELTSYYATCSGTNPLDSSISDAYAALAAISVELEGLTDSTTGACPNDPSLLQAQQEVQVAYAIMDSIYVTEECPPVQSHIDSILHNALCFNIFGGFYTIWVSQFTSSAALFMLCVVASIIYQYFGRYWGMQYEDLQNMMDTVDAENKVPLLPKSDNSIQYEDTTTTTVVPLATATPISYEEYTSDVEGGGGASKGGGTG